MAYPVTAPTGPDDTSGGLIARARGTDPETYGWVPAAPELAVASVGLSSRIAAIEATAPTIETVRTASFALTPSDPRTTKEYPINATSGNIVVTVTGGAENCVLIFRDSAGVCSDVRTIKVASLIEGRNTEAEINTPYGWLRMTWKDSNYGYKLEHSH